MMRTIESNVWCDLASEWIASNGMEDLDALQRVKFRNHASRCHRCTALLLQVSEGGEGMDAALEWPHVADETLRLMVTDGLSSEERSLIETSVEPHLQICDYCADRLAATEEWPEAPELSEAVVGRAVTASVRWRDGRAELGWVMDQAATGLSIWRVALTLSSGVLEARLSPEGSNVPESWRFSVPLATMEELLPTVVFTPDSLVVRSACAAGTHSNWQATPVLSMPLPTWTRLVSVGEDPATMVSLDDSKHLEIALRVPYEGSRKYEDFAPWLNTLLVDLRGERLGCEFVQSDDEKMFAGSVVNKKGQLAGSWTLRFLQDRTMSLVVIPEHAEVIRLATTIEDEVPLSARIRVSKEVMEAESPIAPLYESLDQQHAPQHWFFTALGWLERTLIEVSTGQFQPASELAPVLGSATREYELDLSGLLNELELAPYFDSFKLIVRTEAQASASVRLVPSKPLEGANERPLELRVRLVGSDGQPLGRKPVVLPLGVRNSSEFVTLPGLGDPQRFEGKLEIKIREVPAAVENEQDQ